MKKGGPQDRPFHIECRSFYETIFQEPSAWRQAVP